MTAPRVYCLSDAPVCTVCSKAKFIGCPLAIHVLYASWANSLACPVTVSMVPMASCSMPVWLKVTRYCIW